MIFQVRQPHVIANAAHGNIPARIQINTVAEVGQVLVGGVLLPGLISDKSDTVKSKLSRFAVLHAGTPLTPVVLPILRYLLIEAIEALLLLVKGFPEFFPRQLTEPFVIVAVVDAARELLQVWCLGREQ